jgi:hypothetical protein
MTNGIVKIAFVVGLIGACGYLAYRLGGSVCREDITNQAIKVQQMVQQSDRTITERVLSDSHTNNLRWLCDNYKRAD